MGNQLAHTDAVHHTPVVQGLIYNFLKGETFTTTTEVIWGEFTAFSSTGFWGALEWFK